MLADLYDPLAMSAPLLKAHQQLDRAVDRCYRPEPFPSDRHCVDNSSPSTSSPPPPWSPPPAPHARAASWQGRHRATSTANTSCMASAWQRTRTVSLGKNSWARAESCGMAREMNGKPVTIGAPAVRHAKAAPQARNRPQGRQGGPDPKERQLHAQLIADGRLKSGRCGGYDYYVVNGKQCWRRHTVPKDPRTPAQQRCRARFAAASKAWSENGLLTEAHRRRVVRRRRQEAEPSSPRPIGSADRATELHRTQLHPEPARL